MTQVCITGMGLVAGTGPTIHDAETALREGRSAIRAYDAEEQLRFGQGSGARIRFDVESPIDEPRSLRILRKAVQDAWTDAFGDRDPDPGELQRTGLVIGTSQGAIRDMDTVHRRHADGRRPQDDDRRRWVEYRPGYAADRMAESFGIRGPRSTVGMVCVSSAVAVLQGMWWIEAGLVDRVFACGFEELSPFVQAGFGAINALSPDRLRPFDEGRGGTLLGEAGAVVVLERAETAADRKARPHGWLYGGAISADACHMTAPDRNGRGLESAARKAFDNAGVSPRQVDYICAHGTGTRFNDAMEAKAFARLFGDKLGGRPISSVKSVFGHTLGAAGGVDLISILLGFRGDFVPGTVFHERPLAQLDWDFVPQRARQQDVGIALSTNSAFGGNNTALLVGREPRP